MTIPFTKKYVIGVMIIAMRNPPRKNDAIASAPSRLTDDHVHSIFISLENVSDPSNSSLFTTYVCAGYMKNIVTGFVMKVARVAPSLDTRIIIASGMDIIS